MLRNARVVELAGRTSIRIAGTLLARLGADVVRLCAESAPEPDGHPGLIVDERVADVVFDDGKQVRVVSPAALRHVLAELCGTADAVLTSGEDLDSVTLCPVDFAGTHVHVTPFGLTGPYAGQPGMELTTAAYGGLAVSVGEGDREPLTPPPMLAAHLAGCVAAAAVVTGLDAADAKQRRFDIAECDVLATNPMVGLYSLAFFSGQIPRRAGRRKPNPYPYTILRCQDGAVCMAFLGGHHWRALLDAMGDPTWARDPRFRDRRVMGELHADELDGLVEAWLANHAKADLFALAGSRDIPFGPLMTTRDLLDYEPFAERGFFRAVSVGGSTIKLPWLPFRETTAVAGQRVEARPQRAEGRGPLAGLRVVDLGWVVAAPMVGQFLADLGAEVVKVESRSFLDPGRRGLPLIAQDVGRGDDGKTPNAMPHYNNVNRGKRSIVLNLRTAAGREVLDRLVDGADVVLENVGAGSLERLGLPVERWQARRSDLVVLRISMAGQEGRDAGIPGFAPQATAMGGLDAVCGYPGNEPTGMISTHLGDINAAMYGILAVLAARHRARETGIGTTVDLSMIEASAMPMAPFLAAMQLGSEEPQPQGNEHRTYAPHGLYRCAGEDRWVAIAVRDESEWKALCEVVDAPAEALTLSTSADRRARRNDVDRWISAWTAERSDDAVFTALREVGVPAAPALGPEELLFDEHARARGIVVDLEHHIVGYLPVYGSPFHAEPPCVAVERRAPDLGEHTAEILAELGFTGADLSRLADGGAFDGLDVTAGLAHP